jgi:hypothetical protein
MVYFARIDKNIGRPSRNFKCFPSETLTSPGAICRTECHATQNKTLDL